MNTTKTKLDLALAESQKRTPPQFLLSRAQTSPNLEATRLANSMQTLFNWAEGLELPCIALLGPYNSGKSTLINLLLEQKAAQISNRPTTAAITVFRHTSARPITWPNKAVHGLRDSAQVRSLNPDDVAESCELAGLKDFTTYSDDGATPKYKVVAVFLDAPVLQKMSLIDVPGLGTFKEHSSKHGVDDDAAKLSFERRQQELAIREADGYVLTSNMATSTFNDVYTAELLSLLADGTKFPGTVAHSNWLLVGTNADPVQDSTSDLEKMRNNVIKDLDRLVSSLGESQKSKFDMTALARRVVFTYALDATQKSNKIKEAFEQYREMYPDAAQGDLKSKAEVRVAKSLIGAERLDEIRDRFDNDLSKAVTAGASMLRNHRIAQRCLQSKNYFESEALDILKLRDATAIANYFDQTRAPREQGWETVVSDFEKDCLTQKEKAVQQFAGSYDDLCDYETVYEMLEREFGDNKQACKEHAASLVKKAVEERMKNAVSEVTETIIHNNERRLNEFDSKFMSGKTEHKGIQIAKRDASIDVSSPIISANHAFNVIMATAGTTTLLTAAGVGFAATAFNFVIGTGIAVLGGVGLGGVASAILAAIPFWGWVVLGLGSVSVAMISWFAWRRGTTEKITKSMNDNKSSTMKAVRVALGKHFEEFRIGGVEVLAATKFRINEKMEEFEKAAQAGVPVAVLEECAAYLNSEASAMGNLAKDISPIEGDHNG